jgi:hypothetical protein
MLKKRDYGGAGKRNLNVTAVRRNIYSAGTVNAAFRSVSSVSRKINGA